MAHLNFSSYLMLLNDCLPFELPLIFSNKDYYNFISNYNDLKDFSIKKLEKFKMTIPVNFKITKGSSDTRILSIPHPLSQLYMTLFIDNYGDLLLNYFRQNAIFSIRYPFSKVCFIKKKKKNRIKKDMVEYLEILEEDTPPKDLVDSDYVDSYYIKKTYQKITQFYNSKKLKDFEHKYVFMLKMDYQDCFNRIYTHSIDWAYLGEKNLAKKFIQNKNRFSNVLDRLLQSMNYKETSGIIVGPEFCRWVAEIILCRIDWLVYTELKDERIFYKKDYDVVRFVDDIFVFSNDLKNLEKIREKYISYSSIYKLAINERKTYEEERPFIRDRYWVEKVKRVYDEYSEFLNKMSDSTKERQFYAFANRVIDNIKNLITEYDGKVNSIVSYIFSIWRNNLKKINSEINEHPSEIKRYFYLQQINILFSIIPYALTTPNVLKYIHCVSYILKSAKKNNVDIYNEVYEQLLSLIKYNIPKIHETYNFIIVLASFKKDLPEKLLIEILDSKHHFAIISIAYYMKFNDRLYKYKSLRKKLNDLIDKKCNSLCEEFDKFEDIIAQPDYLLLHEMYSSGVLCKDVKGSLDKAKEMLRRKVGSSSIFEKDKALRAFWTYMQDNNRGFIQWKMTEIDVYKCIITKNITDTVGGGISL